MNVCIVAPVLPPKLDGIGHYTAHLALELARTQQVSVLTGTQQTPTPVEGAQIIAAFSPSRPRSTWEITRLVEAQQPDWVLLQYNPFAYGRWGLNPHLPRAMRAIKRRCPRTRFALMMHEPFVPRNNWKFAVMSTWQRSQLRQLGAAADVLFMSIDPWVRRFQSWFPGKRIVHLPISSSIPLVSIERTEARARLGLAEDTLVAGFFGTIHASRLLEPVKKALCAVRESGRDAIILYIGPHTAQLREAIGDVPMIGEGPLPDEEVSRRFAAMDLYLAPFIDGISTRRSSMMVSLQHGVPVAGTRGELTDEMLMALDEEALLLSDVGDDTGYVRNVLRLAGDPVLRKRLGDSASRFYQQECSWDRIVQKMLDTLSPVG